MSAAALLLPELEASFSELRSEMWYRGDLSWLFHDGQHVMERAYAQKSGQVVVVEVARQFGKSTWGIGKSCETAIANPGCSVRIGTAFYADLSSIILPAFRFILSTCPKELQPKFNDSKGVFFFPNGSEIRLVGLDKNPEKLRGNRLRLIIIDEAGFCNSDKLKYTHRSVIVPATTHEPEAKVVFLSTTPREGVDHYFIDLADEAALESRHVKLTIYDNPLLSQKDIERIAKEMGGFDSDEFRREYMCERIVDKNRAVIPEFSESKHVRKLPRPNYFSHLHRYESLDSGVRDKTALLFGYYDFPSARLVIEDELVLSGPEVTTRNIASGTRRTEKALGYDTLGVYRRPADNDNLILLNDLGEEGIFFYPTSKDSREAMVNAVRLMFADDRIVIDPKCKFLIGTLRSALWNERRDDFERSTLYGHADALASLIYLIRNLDRHTNPIPPWFGAPQSDNILFQHPNNESATARALEGALFGGI